MLYATPRHKRYRNGKRRFQRRFRAKVVWSTHGAVIIFHQPFQYTLDMIRMKAFLIARPSYFVPLSIGLAAYWTGLGWINRGGVRAVFRWWRNFHGVANGMNTRAVNVNVVLSAACPLFFIHRIVWLLRTSDRLFSCLAVIFHYRNGVLTDICTDGIWHLSLSWRACTYCFFMR